MTEPNDERPTIYTIAKAAGVSHTTVSRALSGHPKVSEAQRQRIESIADRLGFVRPNRHATALRTKRSEMVGVLLMDLVNPYNSELAREVDTELRRHGYACMVSGCDGNADEAKGIASLFVDAAVDAIITNVAEPLPALGKGHSPPAVLVSDATVDGYSATVHICVSEGTYQAVKQLFAMGHRRIAHLGAGAHGERYNAYAAAMKEAGLEEILWACGDEGCGRQQLQEKVQRVVRERMADRDMLPTAVVAHDDLMALTVLQSAQEHGLTVPGDISILGHDDTLVTQLVTPKLSSISIPIGDVGRTAARLAMRMSGADLGAEDPVGAGMEGTDGLRCEFVAVPTWRESTAPPRPPRSL